MGAPTLACIGLQDLKLEARITVQVLGAACPWSTLGLSVRWRLARTVEHFHNGLK
jgi:hypothetical protein